MMELNQLTGVSLFSGGGIGDLAMRAAGVRLLVASELLEDRAAVLARNFPEAEVVAGDIATTFDSVVAATRERLGDEPLDILFATPPCQGMSKNGRGKLLNGARAGTRPKLDPRNQLILHALDFVRLFRPRLVVFENVPEMENTVIESRTGDLRGVMEIVSEELGALGYRGRWEVVEFADYGVPQRRQRLITVFTTSTVLQRAMRVHGTALPPRTHMQTPRNGQRPWVTVVDALCGVPPLDAKDKKLASSALPYHRVPVLDRDKYFWVANTPPGRGAFDNQCVNPKCLYQGNTTHGSTHDEEGINRANTHTPVNCERCGELLPRPWVVEDGVHRLMRGFTSAYKRMRGDLPASALTRNLSYACSDQKLHPDQNRVLSLHEAFILHTVSDYEFTWARVDGKKLSDKTIREIIGESIPPRGLQVIFDYLAGHLAAMPAPPWTDLAPLPRLPTADRTALVERVQALEAAREEHDRSLVGMTEERDLWRGLYEGQRRCGDRLMGERDELRDRLDEAHVERDTARRERDIHKRVADEAIARLREYEDERRDARKGLR